MKILFYSNQLCLRGTEVNLYEYAKYNEEILGNESVIATPHYANLDALPKFRNRFRVELISEHIETFSLKEKPDWVYITKAGNNDGLSTTTIPCFIHVVFRYNQPHGNKYVYISDWLAKDQGYDTDNYSLPYIVNKLPEVNSDLRKELNIPKNAVVFGCYGGSTEFNIYETHNVIKRTVKERNDVYFLFMNINKFCEDHPQIIHLPGTWNLEAKSAFINTCDAMLHARRGGETFGLAVAEFSMNNKPVITYKLSGEACHIELLGERGIYYTTEADLYDIINNLKSYIKYNDYYTCYKNNSPEIIMEKFKKLITL